MAAKKQLELTPTPLDGGEAESRYESDRRLELTTKSGNTHRGFSHESGTIKVDDSGVAEYRERAEKEGAERAAKRREQIEKEDSKLQVLLDKTPSQQMWEERIDDANRWGRALLIGLTVYFGLRGAYELVCLVRGKEQNEFWPFITLAAMAGVVLSFRAVPQRLLWIGARFAYAFGLIYFGIRGLVSLYNLYQNPPARGVSWAAGGWSLLGTALTVIALVFIYRGARVAFRRRDRVLAMLDGHEEPNLPFGITYTNRNQLRYYLYALEGSFLVMGLLVLTFLGLRIDPLSFALVLFTAPQFAFLYLFPFFLYVGYRSQLFPHV